MRPPSRARGWRGLLLAAAAAAVRGAALRVGGAPAAAAAAPGAAPASAPAPDGGGEPRPGGGGRRCPGVARRHGRCGQRPAAAAAASASEGPSSPAASPAVPAGAAPAPSGGGYVDCSASDDFVEAYERQPEEALRDWRCGDLSAAVLRERMTIACIGDSTTHGLNVARGEEYPSVLHRLLSKQFPKQFNVINLGVTSSSARHDGNHSYWKFPQWSIAAEARIDIAVVMLGLNDAYHLGWAQEEYERDYLEMVQEILRLHSNATIIVAVPPQGAYAFRNDKVRGGGDWALRLTRRSLAQAVEKVRSAAQLETPAINFFDIFARAASLKPNAVVKYPGPSITADELYLKDGIHPSALGYSEMAAAAAAAISKDAMSTRSFRLSCESSAHPDLCKAFCNNAGKAKS